MSSNYGNAGSPKEEIYGKRKRALYKYALYQRQPVYPARAEQRFGRFDIFGPAFQLKADLFRADRQQGRGYKFQGYVDLGRRQRGVSRNAGGKIPGVDDVHRLD